MCGRYQFNISYSDLSKSIQNQVDNLSLDFKQGEIFPGDDVLVIIPKMDKISLKVMKWGIKDKNKYLQINARIETINNNFYYRDIVINHCCVIANGFYEWDKDKHKYYFRSDDEFIYLAAIYNNKDELLIITKQADECMNDIHERMPVILNKDEMLKYILNDELSITKKDLIINKQLEKKKI